MSEFLRVYQVADGMLIYTDITTAQAGGFSNLVITRVRNGAGSLSFDLEGVTAAQVNAWIDEASKVELYVDAALHSTWYVDEYDIQWGGLICHVECIGLLSLGSGTITSTQTSQTAQTLINLLVAEVPEWSVTYTGTNKGTLFELVEWSEKSITEALQEICLLAGLTFYFDSDGVLNVEDEATDAVNLLTENQFSVETDTTGFAATDAAIVRDATTSSHGAACLKLTGSGSGDPRVYAPATGSTAVAVTAGSAYTFTVMAKAAAAAQQMRLIMRWVTGVGAYVSQDYVAALDVDTIFSKQSMSATAPATAEAVSIGVTTEGGLSDVLFLDEFKFGQGSPAETFDLGVGGNAHSFRTGYTAREIVNRLTITIQGGQAYTYNDVASQGKYGIREQRLTKSWIGNSQVAQRYADAVLAYSANPKQEIEVEADYDAALQIGAKAEVIGLEDGRTYEGLIQQIIWTMGDIRQQVSIGWPPLSLREGIERDNGRGADETGSGDPDDPFDPDVDIPDNSIPTDKYEDGSVTADKVSTAVARRSIVFNVSGSIDDATFLGKFKVPTGMQLTVVSWAWTTGTGTPTINDIPAVDDVLAANDVVNPSFDTGSTATDLWLQINCDVGEA